MSCRFPVEPAGTKNWRNAALTRWLRVVIYPLAFLRLPYTILPYLCRALFYLGFGFKIGRQTEQTWFEIVRVAGDVVNWLVVSWIAVVVCEIARLPTLLACSFIFAEAVRLVSEKGVIVCSGIWQQLPHRRLAKYLESRGVFSNRFAGYIRYYASEDAERMGMVLGFLARCAGDDAYLALRLGYVKQFRTVPDSHPLRAGHVRDVARGEIFIHRRWTNDPYLLIGQALRRSPWIFDPRLLTRPFYYRTQANPLVTAFVLDYWLLTPPFALFQFGHEIKAARYELFFRGLRALGWNLEGVVGANGIFEFDPLLHWLAYRLGHAALSASEPTRWDETQVIKSSAARLDCGDKILPLDVAEKYTLPLCYVEQVLWGKILSQTNLHG